MLMREYVGNLPSALEGRMTSLEVLPSGSWCEGQFRESRRWEANVSHELCSALAGAQISLSNLSTKHDESYWGTNAD